jgi:Transposase
MGRREPGPSATREEVLRPQREWCSSCGKLLSASYHNRRTVRTLQGVCQLTVVIRRCGNPECERYHVPYHPEEEGIWALPHGEFGLAVIALVGALRYGEHRSVPEIHQQLRLRGLQICERSVTHLVERYEELVALHLADESRLQELLGKQGRVILSIDGLEPDAGHEVLWVLRDCLSGELLLARALLSSTGGDLAALLQEAKEALPVAITAVISDAEPAIRTAVSQALPAVPHQLCQFHYLRQAAKPIADADQRAKKDLKKQIRGVRPLERALEGRTDQQAEATRRYCLAVRSSLTDDGRPPLGAAGLRLHERLELISSSIGRVAEKGGHFLQS